MFTKKKSLARIAKLRSKKEREIIMSGSCNDVDTGTEDDDEEAEEEEDSEEEIRKHHMKRNSHKRMSWHPGALLTSNAGLRLSIPSMRKASSTSTPNLTDDLVDGGGVVRGAEAQGGTYRNPPSRNHSLKYSGGALHGALPSAAFDHTFVGGSEGESRQPSRSPDPDSSSRLRRRVLRKKTSGGSVDEHISTTSSSSSTGVGHRRVQSFRLAPIVKLQNEEGLEEEVVGTASPPIQIPRASTPNLLRHRHSIAGHDSRPSSTSPPMSPSRRVPITHYPVPPPQGSPTSSSTVNPASSSTPGEEDYPFDDDPNGDYSDNDSYYGDNPSIYCTPPSSTSTAASAAMKQHQSRGRRKESVSKSKSMISLSSNSEQGGGVNGKPVSAHEARGRSYLMGSVGATSLLGTAELEKCFPDRTLRLFVGSWNMNGNTPPRHLADFLLPHNLDYVPDILVVGTQEAFPERHEWEVRLQDTLGPSHVLYHSATLGTLHQAIFLRRDLIWYCSVPDTDSFNTRPASQFRTKGAIATAFMLFGTSFLFVNSHLTAHTENTKDRIKDVKKINAMLNLPKDTKNMPLRNAKAKDISDRFDTTFWSGDLNFRLEQSREVVLREVKEGVSVLDFDQLNYLRQEGFIFKGFRESEIQFSPTYKYDVGTNSFDTSSKQRTPSYTDRILYKFHPSTKVKALYYDSVQNVTSSDHKPVWGMWEVKIRPGRDSINLGGGLFNREVYLDGMKRRSEALQPALSGKHGAHMCNIS